MDAPGETPLYVKKSVIMKALARRLATISSSIVARVGTPDILRDPNQPIVGEILRRSEGRLPTTERQVGDLLGRCGIGESVRFAVGARPVTPAIRKRLGTTHKNILFVIGLEQGQPDINLSQVSPDIELL